MTPASATSWAIVALAAVGIARVAFKPPFRRDLAELPRLVAGLIVAVPTGMAVATLVFIRVPLTLHLAAIAAVTGSAFLWWRSRPDFGRARGLPPGSLGIGASLDAIDNKAFYQEQAALHGPIFKMSQFGRPVLCIIGLSRGRKLLMDHAEALAGASLPYSRFVAKGVLRYMPREHHQEEGPLFRRAFSETVLDAQEVQVRTSCQRHLEALLTVSASGESGADIRPFLVRWTTDALASAFFGIAPGDPRLDDIDRAQRAMQLDRSGGAAWRAAMEGALVSASSVLREIGELHIHNGDARSVLGALVNRAPDSLNDEGRLRNLFFMFRLGTGDLAAALAWVAYHLSIHPELQEKVRATGRTVGPPRGMHPGDLATRVVLETLRLEQSEFLYRRVVKPLTFEGFSIPAGWILRICVQESHRDPDVFPNPATFDPDRFIGRSLSKSEYATFGLDGHGCMGASMVHFFGRILVEELCLGYTTRVTRDGPFEHGTRHRHHWRPSRNWQVTLDRCG